MPIITWLVVGLVAGLLASAIVRSGLGLLGHIVVGIAGAFVGGWTFRELGWHAPFAGTAGVIAVAFVGAVILLVILNFLRFASTRSQQR